MPSPIIVGVALRDDDSAPLALAHRLARLTAALVTSYPYDESPPFVASEGLAAMREQAELALEPLVATSPDDVNVSTYVGPGTTAARAYTMSRSTLTRRRSSSAPATAGASGAYSRAMSAPACCTARRAQWWSRLATTPKAPTGSAGSVSGSSIRSKGTRR
jgi:hypothetical protein